jgi:hypothetical protein
MNFSEIVFLLLVIFFGFILIVGPSCSSYEGFQAGMPGVRCGVDLPTCQNGLQCINGFCGAARQSNLPPNELPVYP